MPRALITGVAGQDGSYLAEHLLARGYEVFGTMRPEMADSPRVMPYYMRNLDARIKIIPVRLDRPTELDEAFRAILPDECYHLGGPSVVDSGQMDNPVIFSTIVESTRALVQAIKEVRPACRMFLAGSSEMFGSASAAQQNELTAFNPRSTYGLARVAAYDVVRGYRKEGLFACTGILYNHESPRRAPFFLPRKVSLGVAAIKHGRQEKLMLGNLSAVRDWGYAPDYVEAMWTILQAKEPDDFVVATGKLHTVEQLVATAFSSVDLDYRDFVGVDPQFVRPVEAFPLCGDPARIQAATGWRARREFSAIIAEMVAADIALQSRDGMRA